MPRYGWGIDVGVASLGFAVIELNHEGIPQAIVDGVSRVWTAPVGASERRAFKSSRIQNSRRRKRKRELREKLSRFLHVPENFHESKRGSSQKPEKTINSKVRLRALGMQKELTSIELAQALYHIAENRGQRLSRGLGEADDKEAQKERQSTAARANQTKQAMDHLGDKLGRSLYPGEFLWEREKEGLPTRLKKSSEDSPVFTRSQVEQECRELLQFQSKFHSGLSEQVKNSIFETVFWEETPKPQKIGRCRYGIKGSDGEPEPRISKGSSLFQTKRIYEEVNHLRLHSPLTGTRTPLTKDQRDIIAGYLLKGDNVTAAKARTLLKLGKGADALKTTLDINLKGGRKSEAVLKGHPVAAAMKKAGLSEKWEAMNDGDRESLSSLMREEDDLEAFIKKAEAFGVKREEALTISEFVLPSGYAAAGETATRYLLSELRSDVISLFEAERRARLSSSRPPVSLERLPYYGEILAGSCIGGTGHPADTSEVKWGRIANPVVHVALNQIRKTANTFLKLYGKPDRICLELSRDMNKSAEEREKLERDAETNRKRNEQAIEKLVGTKKKLSRDDLLKIKLYHMQGEKCLYTGREISKGNLFDGSTEIDHILPREITRDDGIANLALVDTQANRFKDKRSPYEAFSGGYKGRPYKHILDQALQRGKQVYWRFQPDAMDRFKDQNAFQARFLNDTRFVAKATRAYLSAVCNDPNEVICLNGRLTSALRRQWGLSWVMADLMIEDGAMREDEISRPKEESLEEIQERRKHQKKIRWDHRHHLLDAIIAGCTTRSDVYRLQTMTGRGVDVSDAASFLKKLRDADEDTACVGLPWQEDFRGEVMAFLRGSKKRVTDTTGPKCLVTVKPDRNPAGALHAQTNYSAVCINPAKPEQYLVFQRVDLTKLIEKPDLEKALERLDVSSSVLSVAEKAVESGAEIWWGRPDPVTPLKLLIRDLENLKADLKRRYGLAPLDMQTHKARLDWAIKNLSAETGRKAFQIPQVLSVRALKGPLFPGAAPRMVVPTKGNDCLIYWLKKDGDAAWQVVSTLDANSPGFIEDWERENGRKLFTIKKDDVVEMLEDPQSPSSGRRLYRLASLSPGDLEFLPITEARAPKEVPNSVRTRISSLKALAERQPRQVVMDASGREQWRSHSRN